MGKEVITEKHVALAMKALGWDVGMKRPLIADLRAKLKCMFECAGDGTTLGKKVDAVVAAATNESELGVQQMSAETPAAEMPHELIDLFQKGAEMQGNTFNFLDAGVAAYIRRQRTEFEKEQAIRDAVKHESSELRINELEADLNGTIQALDDQDHQLERQSAEIEEIKTAIAVSSGKLEMATAELKEAHARKDELALEVTSAKEAAAKIGGLYTALLEENMNSQLKHKELVMQFESVSKDMAIATGRMAEQEKTIMSQEKRIEELTTLFEASTTAAATISGRFEAVTTEFDRVKARAIELDAIVDGKSLRLGELEGMLAASKNNHSAPRPARRNRPASPKQSKSAQGEKHA